MGGTTVRSRAALKIGAGYVLAAASLAWVFHDVDLAAIFRLAAGMRLWWLAPAIACDVLSYVCQAQRWRLLLRPAGDLPLTKAVQAIYAGLFTNEVVPLRFGEVVRGYLAAKAIRRSVAWVVPSMAVGRLIDSIWMAAGTGLVLLFVPVPAEFATGAETFGAVIAGFTAIFVLIVLRPPAFLERWGARRDSRFKSFVADVLTGVSRVGLNAQFAAAATYSLALLLLQAGAFWFVMVSCGLPLGYGAAAAVFLIVHLGTALPNAPANVGSFQFFTILGLQLFGVDKSAAAGFSVVVFLVLTLPLWTLGLAAISTTGVTLAEIRADVNPSSKGEHRPVPDRFVRVERAWPDRPF
jgi:uncharacterized protein (TIRG00374 family)